MECADSRVLCVREVIPSVMVHNVMICNDQIGAVGLWLACVMDVWIDDLPASSRSRFSARQANEGDASL